MDGWIKLYRQVTGNKVWKCKPFSKGQAWVDILLSVNHQEGEVLFGNTSHKVPKGGHITSLQKLADRWGWSPNRVKRFLCLLQNESMLTFECCENRTELTVTNWDFYQGNGTPTEHQRNTSGTSTETNNNDNNDKNNIYISAEQKENAPHKKIIDYLNQQTGKNYSHAAKINQDKIRARWKEGYTIEDFKRVIDIKVSHWLHDEKMRAYLRPQTLFSQKFDWYLQQKPTPKQKQKQVFS